MRPARLTEANGLLAFLPGILTRLFSHGVTANRLRHGTKILWWRPDKVGGAMHLGHVNVKGASCAGFSPMLQFTLILRLVEELRKLIAFWEDRFKRIANPEGPIGDACLQYPVRKFARLPPVRVGKLKFQGRYLLGRPSRCILKRTFLSTKIPNKTSEFFLATQLSLCRVGETLYHLAWLNL